ncbi:hypothetical protein CI238_01358 [Colletotrichum incanum]|uniref:Uncharacterized protein n=1 Tax=Colletotrichum incanum TaxID=1573173 RepID=A0A166ZVH6_COLIC|nr:hypothetical protein CI238_01358 [Colletotrichum incanum]
MVQYLTGLHSDDFGYTSSPSKDPWTDPLELESNSPQPYPLLTEAYDISSFSQESTQQTILQSQRGPRAGYSNNSYPPGLANDGLLLGLQCHEPGLLDLDSTTGNPPVTLGLGVAGFDAPYDTLWENPVIDKRAQSAYNCMQLPLKTSTQSIEGASFSTQFYDNGLDFPAYPDLDILSQCHTLSVLCSPESSLRDRAWAAGTDANVQASQSYGIPANDITTSGFTTMPYFTITECESIRESSAISSSSSASDLEMLNCTACDRFQGDVKSLSTLRDLGRHQESAHQKSTLICYICLRSFSGNRADNLQRHIRNKHPLEVLG